MYGGGGKFLASNLEYDHEAADVGAEGGAKNGKVHGLAQSRIFISLRKTTASNRRFFEKQQNKKVATTEIQTNSLSLN